MSAAQKPTIIITRPRPFAQELAAEVGRAGWKPIVLDVLATKTAENVAELRRDVRFLLPVEQAVFTSRSSVTHTFEILDRDDFSSSGITAMGAGSASDLKAKGFASVLLPELGTTSEDLLALDQFSAHRAGRAIIFCAPGGRDVIQRELENRGWQVDIAEVYERVVQAPKASNIFRNSIFSSTNHRLYQWVSSRCLPGAITGRCVATDVNRAVGGHFRASRNAGA